MTVVELCKKYFSFTMPFVKMKTFLSTFFTFIKIKYLLAHLIHTEIAYEMLLLSQTFFDRGSTRIV